MELQSSIRAFLAVLAVWCLMIICSATAAAQSEGATDEWARWRGPNGNGVAPADSQVPLRWSETKNVVWKTKIPGRGHSSPIVVDGRIFLTSADEGQQTQSVLCFQQSDGQLLWSKVVSTGGFPSKIHDKNTHASSTVAVADGHVLAVFLNHDSIQATCFDFEGTQVWQRKVGDYQSNYPFGYGSSPIAYKDLFIVPNENQIKSSLVALDVKTGEPSWRIDRKLPEGYDTVNGLETNYSTPVIARVADQDQLLLSGGNRVSSYDPATGKERWQCPASWDVTCGTVVWDDKLNMVFASGGYPTQETLGVKADGSSKQVWTKPVKCYEQSLIVVDGYLYGQSDRGVIYCWNASDGELQWRERFEGPESASPIAVGEHIFFTSEKGTTLVIKANPEKFEPVAKSKLGSVTFASLAVVGNQLLVRTAFKESDQLQEYLMCLGE